jgi:hypothetical protein
MAKIHQKGISSGHEGKSVDFIRRGGVIFIVDCIARAQKSRHGQALAFFFDNILDNQRRSLLYPTFY